jgi:DNA-binding NarL/FixJ family response regulator
MSQHILALIVDDDPRSRKGLRALLGTCQQIRIIGEAPDGREALRLVEQLSPDVVLMDVRMPLMDGLEATRRIKNQWPHVNVIVLSLYNTYRAEALAAGAAAFLVKGCPSEELLEAIRSQGSAASTKRDPSPTPASSNQNPQKLSPGHDRNRAPGSSRNDDSKRWVPPNFQPNPAQP